MLLMLIGVGVIGLVILAYHVLGPTLALLIMFMFPMVKRLFLDNCRVLPATTGGL